MVSTITPAGVGIGININARVGSSNIGPGSNVAARGEPARSSPTQATNAGIENSISANDTIRPIDGISLSPQILVALSQSSVAQSSVAQSSGALAQDSLAQTPQDGASQVEGGQVEGAQAQSSQETPPNATGNNAANGQELTPEEQEQLRELQQRDQEVRAHEQAHATVGGPYAGAPTYETVRGPDGQQYAVAGEVQIDASPENDPEATIRKLEVVVRAALAPADPSPQDRQVAQQARQGIIEARAELREERENEQNGGESNNNNPADNTDSNPIQSLLQQAIQGFERADETQDIGQSSPIQTNDNQDDQVDISQDAEQIIATLFG